MNNKPTINQYLISTCLFIIDELNESYGKYSKSELKLLADEKYNEMDIVVRIGYPFRNMVHYTVGDFKKTETKFNHDLYIQNKDFKIEIKYLKNWKSKSNTNSNSKTWKEFQEDFNWLFSEIDNGFKNNRAFIIGWFNCVDYFSQLIQLGNTKGSKSLVNEERVQYFPFFKKTKSPTYTTDLAYNYSQSYEEVKLNLIGKDSSRYNCIFLGNEKDCFHFAIYY